MTETEWRNWGSEARKALAMVDFPAPDGAEITKQTPRRFNLAPASDVLPCTIPRSNSRIAHPPANAWESMALAAMHARFALWRAALLTVSR
ncbi:hypothetical protein ACLEIY_05045 [Acetobacter tropicalis]|nr:hypothetical protein [Acetobacter tropicalis]